MKRILGLLTLALAIACTASATTLTGTIKKPDGTNLTGRLRLTLSHPAKSISAGAVVMPQPINITVTAGALTGTPTVYGNDDLQPANTYYWAEYFTAAGTKLMQNAFYIAGAAFDIGAATPTTITTSNISYSDVNAGANSLRADLASTVTGKGDELVGYKASGTGSVARTVHSRFADMEIAAADYGFATAASATTNTAALTAAIAVAASGQTIQLPAGVFEINGTISLAEKHGVTLRGMGKPALPTGTVRLTYGTVLKWVGGASDVIIDMTSAQFASVEDLGVDGMNVASLTGIQIDSDNDPISRMTRLKGVSVHGMGDDWDNGIGIAIGTSGAVGRQSDLVYIDDFLVSTCGIGIKINSANAMQESTISNGFIYYCNTHIDVLYGPAFKIDSVQMAVYRGTTPSSVKITTGLIKIINCIMQPDEVIGAVDGYGLWIVTASYLLPIEISNSIVHNVQIDGDTAKVTSFNNRFDSLTIVGVNATWISMNDVKINFSTGAYLQWEDIITLDPGTAYSLLEISEYRLKWHGLGSIDYGTDHVIKVAGTQRGSIGDYEYKWGHGTLSPLQTVTAEGWKVAYTVDSATNVFTCSNTFANGEKVQVIPDTGGTLASPLAAFTDYYVIDAGAGTFKLSLTLGGAEIDILSNGVATQNIYFSEPVIGRMQISARTGVYYGTASDHDVYLIRDSGQKWMVNSNGDLRSISTGGLGTGSRTYSQLGAISAPYAGLIHWCSDCTVANCAAAGSGALAVYSGSGWICK